MSQSDFLAITWNFLKARKKSRAQVAVGIGFAPHFLRNSASVAIAVA